MSTQWKETQDERKPDVLESAYQANEERVVRMPPDINSQIYELRRMIRLYPGNPTYQPISATDCI